MNHKGYILRSINSSIVEESRQVLSTTFLEEYTLLCLYINEADVFDEAPLQVNENRETYQDLQKIISIRSNIVFCRRHLCCNSQWPQS